MGKTWYKNRLWGFGLDKEIEREGIIDIMGKSSKTCADGKMPVDKKGRTVGVYSVLVTSVSRR